MSNFRMIRPYQHYAKCALLIGAALISIAPAGRNSAVATTTAPQTNEFGPAAKWVSNFGYDAGGWRVEQHPRMMADVNGDGKQDVVGFSSDGVVVSLSIGSSFTETQLWVGEFGYTAGGWRVDKNPRMMADVNGDGKQDVVGFSNDAVWVALSTGSGFGTAQPWVDGFGYDTGGWRIDKHPRMMADVNGDHKQDVVGFSSDGVLVSLSTGSSFTKTQLWVGEFGYTAGGWRVDKNPRMMADVNGDGKQDVVGFANDAVWVALSTGSSFGTPQPWVDGFGYDTGGWRVEQHPRMMADVNGDGSADVVGFGTDGTLVATSRAVTYRVFLPRLSNQ